MSDLLVAYDPTLWRPGCALLQAALGGTRGIATSFPTETWLLAPTPNLQVYRLRNTGELQQLVSKTKEYHTTRGK